MAKNPRFNKDKKNVPETPLKVYPNVTKAPEQTNDKLVVNNIVYRSVDRTPKNVGSWRESHRAAESIYYPNRTRLYDLYADIDLDGHLTGIKRKYIKTVLRKKIRFVKNNKQVDDVSKLIYTNEFRQLIKEILESIFWGVSGFEFLPGEKFKFKVIPRKHIKPEKKVIAINQTDYDGIPYEDISNIWVIGEERDLGLYLKCAFYVLLKKGDFSDWANYIEIFGSPVIVTKYDTFDEKTKLQLTNMMEEAGASLKLMIPKQADFEIMDGKTSNGNGDLQDKFKDACNEELSVLVLGNTETTKSSKSSGYAQAKEHGEQQDVIIEDDTQFVINLLNSDKFLDILTSYGYDVDGGCFELVEKKKPAEQKERAEVLQILKELGLPMDDDALYEEFAVLKPKDYDRKKAEAIIEEEEEEDPETNIDKKTTPPVPGGKTKKAPKLRIKDKLFSTISDFFDQARKD